MVSDDLEPWIQLYTFWIQVYLFYRTSWLINSHLTKLDRITGKTHLVESKVQYLSLKCSGVKVISFQKNKYSSKVLKVLKKYT